MDDWPAVRALGHVIEAAPTVVVSCFAVLTELQNKLKSRLRITAAHVPRRGSGVKRGCKPLDVKLALRGGIRPKDELLDADTAAACRGIASDGSQKAVLAAEQAVVTPPD